MNKHKFSFSRIPGWAILLVIFGVLYLTGLHTETIGQLQRLMLATGLKKADVPEAVPSPEKTVTSPASTSEMAGAGFRMTTLDGQSVSFESLRGKVVFLNIWATWCPPCVAEMPNIQRLYEKVNSPKIAFVMLSVDAAGLPKVQKHIQKKGYTFPVYLPDTPLPQEFESPSIPSTFIISPEGKIVSKQIGLADYDTQEMRDFLLSLAK
ncbi:TlpA family protein disulfide reductase [Rufibacter latericius]|uniref:TlpA family protein disulfide reductase n=1 Tax=Rufibacter latericius TaxID=2487040 RepID=A0A3M9MAI3_9BACT|nr:TlpA disulfide reductase family protein [Rufibacter latericius]RNI22579.1 TlpA family protein disulfide reductase [Rufibacter latericius]